MTKVQKPKSAADWFTSSGTSRRNGNTIVPLVDGEATWLDVFGAVTAASKTVHLAFWMMNLDHELRRPAGDTLKDPGDRDKDTLFTLLERKRQQDVTIRILLWILPTIPATEKELISLLVPNPFFPLIDLLKALAVPPSILATLDMRILKAALLGHYQVLLEPHPTHALGSWHQKTIIVDDEVAFLGGMNAKENDWDATHAVYDYRRMPHSSSGAERSARSKAKDATKFPPRHDCMARLEGPLVTDVQNNFIARWNQAIDDKRFFHRNLLKILAKSFQPSAGSGSQVGQVVRTMPKYKPTPTGERGCLEIYQRAIRNASKYVYIEDQYFRSQTIALELARAAKRNPKLIVVVVTMPDILAESEWLNIGLATPSTYWTADSFDIIAKVIPDFCFFCLKANDVDAAGDQVYLMVDLHAKIMIVDDEWYTIGSCNINERGFDYEGEINVGVHDPAGALALRLKLWGEHMRGTCPKDVPTATKLWYEHARLNVDAEKKKARPVSLVYSFAQKGPLLPIVPKTWF